MLCDNYKVLLLWGNWKSLQLSVGINLKRKRQRSHDDCNLRVVTFHEWGTLGRCVYFSAYAFGEQTVLGLVSNRQIKRLIFRSEVPVTKVIICSVSSTLLRSKNSDSAYGKTNVPEDIRTLKFRLFSISVPQNSSH